MKVPALDSCEPQVMRALEKAAWTILRAPYYLNVAGLIFFADLRAQQIQTDNGRSRRIIVAEIKCFANETNDQDELYRAIGQYALYREALRMKGDDDELYLAVSEPAYQRLLRLHLVARVLHDLGVKLIVIDLEREVIFQWIE
ncbi:MAG: element excision factor XisH family protein [Chloroflexota bacterium]|nr:element excision factor XisH family protein [Chloroflexota bacterium]